jgi:hypothetical protein
MKLPISESLMTYFDQVRNEKAWFHQNRRTDKVKMARKKSQYKKYKHKEESTTKEEVAKYQVSSY